MQPFLFSPSRPLSTRADGAISFDVLDVFVSFDFLIEAGLFRLTFLRKHTFSVAYPDLSPTPHPPTSLAFNQVNSRAMLQEVLDKQSDGFRLAPHDVQAAGGAVHNLRDVLKRVADA